MIKIIMWVVVALVIIGGVFWFMSGDSSEQAGQNLQNQDNSVVTEKVSESSSIESDDEVFTEIENALEGLE